MANKKKKTAPTVTNKANSEPGGLSAKHKKTIVVILVLLVVVAASVWIDNSVRNPPIKDETDSMNAIFGQNVVADNKEILYETPVEIKTYEPEKINGKEYWRVDVIAGDEPNTKLYGPYYVAGNNSKIYLKDAAGQLVPYGV